MPDYKKMYVHLAHRMADIVDMAIAAEKEAEELYYQTTKDPVSYEVWKRELAASENTEGGDHHEDST